MLQFREQGGSGRPLEQDVNDISSADVILEAGEHASWVSPSGWKKFSLCAASPWMESHFQDTSSEFAAEGTAAHWVREQCLTTGKDVNEFFGLKIAVKEKDAQYLFEVTPDWERFLQPGIDRLRDEADTGELFVERRVHLDPWVEGQHGSCDAIVAGKKLNIIDDLKFGRGVAVSAERNGQLMQYALAAWNDVIRHLDNPSEDFLLRIDQPRVPGGGSEWRCTLEDLLRFAEDEYVPAYQATLDPDAPYYPDIEACRFCKAAENAACPGLHQFMSELLGLNTNETDLTKEWEMPEIDQLSPARRSYVLKQKPLVEKWVRSLHTLQLNEATAGRETPGFKAVNTQGNREWRDPEEAQNFFEGRVPKKEMFNQTLKSPTQMELVAGTRIWNKAQDLIHRPEGKPALVPESDPRPAIIPAIDLLDDLDDEDMVGAGTEVEEIDELI